MYIPQTEPLPTLDLPEPTLHYPLMKALRSIIQLYARALKFREPVLLYPERLVRTYKDFTDGKNRMIAGFRHPYGDDPQLTAYLFHHVMPKAARKIGIKLPRFTHAHFIYGVEVPMWSGPFVRWLLPRVGAVPINHIHMDAKGMSRIRKLFSEGTFPVALAPEGHVTYGSERVLELETGTARFGFWCLEDLEKAGRTESVFIVPLSSHYRYGKRARTQLSRMIRTMEIECGLLPKGSKLRTEDSTDKAVADRLSRIGPAILSHLLAFYGEYGGLPVINGTESAPEFPSADTQKVILEAALLAAERMLGIPCDPQKKAILRLYTIRTAGWDRLFRSDLREMTPLRFELAKREAGEAWFAMRHMELSELLIYVDFRNIPAEAHFETLVEIAHNFFDALSRLKGGTLRNRANIIDRYPVIVPGEPLNLNAYREKYKKDKKGAMQDVTVDLHDRFERCIEEYRHEFR